MEGNSGQQLERAIDILETRIERVETQNHLLLKTIAELKLDVIKLWEKTNES